MNTKKPLVREHQRPGDGERFCMKYITEIENVQEEEEVEDYDFFNEGYPGDGYDEFSEFSGWRDLVL